MGKYLWLCQAFYTTEQSDGYELYTRMKDETDAIAWAITSVGVSDYR